MVTGYTDVNVSISVDVLGPMCVVFRPIVFYHLTI